MWNLLERRKLDLTALLRPLCKSRQNSAIEWIFPPNLHKTRALTAFGAKNNLLASTVERVGYFNVGQSEVG
jgi:hypothetical protein